MAEYPDTHAAKERLVFNAMVIVPVGTLLLTSLTLPWLMRHWK